MHSFIYLTKTSRGFSTGYKVIKTKKVPTMKEFIFLLVEMNKQQENKLINKIISDSDKWCQNKTGSYDRMTSLREGHTLLDWGQRGPVLSEKVTFELGPEWQERKSPLKIHTLFLSLSLTHTHTLILLCCIPPGSCILQHITIGHSLPRKAFHHNMTTPTGQLSILPELMDSTTLPKEGFPTLTEISLTNTYIQE